MNILIITIGSRGDVQPYVALGQGLLAAGHAVTLCTSSRFEAFVTETGLAYASLNDELVALLDSAQGRGAIEDMGSLVSGIKTASKLLRRVGPIQQALLQEAWLVARAVNPDIIIYSPKMAGAPHYADKLRIDAAMAVLFPQFVPTTAYPSLTFPRWKLGGWYNKLTYKFVLAIAGRVGSRYVKEWKDAFNANLKRGAYNKDGHELIEITKLIHGQRHSAVEYRYMRRAQDGTLQPADDQGGLLALFGFDGDRIVLIEEYW